MFSGVRVPRTRSQKVWFGILAAMCVFTFGVLVDNLVVRYALGGALRWIDDAAGALIAGLLVALYERHRHRALVEKLRTIQLMNHHVRNALQAIVYARFSSNQEQEVARVNEAVGRIDWALREILPGVEADLPVGKQDAA